MLQLRKSKLEILYIFLHPTFNPTPKKKKNLTKDKNLTRIKVVLFWPLFPLWFKSQPPKSIPAFL